MIGMKTLSAASLAVCLLLPLFANTVSAYREPVSPEASKTVYAYEGIAQELYGADILRGDGTDFMLDDVPDRLQACVMVVRMRGEEAAAIAAYEAEEISCPFTDIGDDAAWAKPYLAWLYEKKIMLGIGDGKFGNGDCTAQMYVTFMLRALGYADTGDNFSVLDFSFADALSFAKEQRIWDETLAGEPFTRGVMAAVTYQTLSADCKDAEFSLLESLVLSGAVAVNDAKPILEKAHARNDAEKRIAVLDAVMPNPARPTFARTEWNVVTVEAASEPTTQSVVLTTETAHDEDSIYVTGEFARNGAPFGTVSMRYANGMLYRDICGETSIEYEATDADALCFDLRSIGLVPYYAIDAFDEGAALTQTEHSDGSVVISVALSDWLAPKILRAFETEVDPEDAMVSSDIVMEMTYVSDGSLSEMQFSGVILCEWMTDLGNVTSKQYTLTCEMTH